MIEPGQFLLDQIHSDVSSSYLSSYLEAKYYVIFLENYDKTSKVVLFLNKVRVLSVFDLFWKRNQYRKVCIWCLCINSKGGYDSHIFKNYCEEHGII